MIYVAGLPRNHQLLPGSLIHYSLFKNIVYTGAIDKYLDCPFYIEKDMQKIGDKIIYNATEEILDPSHAALVVWDVQKMLVSRIFNKEEFISNLTLIIELARKATVPIFFTRHQKIPMRFESSARIYTFSKLGFDRMWQQPTEEDMAFAIKPVQQSEIVIDKHTASIFIDTSFEYMLRNAGIISVVFTGIATEYGIESSARDAFNRGFYSVIVSDCVSSNDSDGHNRSLENMKNLTTIISSKEVENIWSKVQK
jgi:nicotinamidase-related amidase